jgi:hypothetical protein
MNETKLYLAIKAEVERGSYSAESIKAAIADAVDSLSRGGFIEDQIQSCIDGHLQVLL